MIQLCSLLRLVIKATILMTSLKFFLGNSHYLALIFVLLFTTFYSGCTHLSISGELGSAAVIEEGLSECFPEGLRLANETLASCEASAAAYIDGDIYVASDKALALPRSAFFKYSATSSRKTVGTYLLGPIFSSVKKTEDMAVDHASGTVFSTSGFDRVKKASHSWDSFNSLIAYKPGSEEDVKVFNKEINDGHVSSLAIRDMLRETLGTPYFKVEGLAHLPNQTLLFGIREMGDSYKEFSPVVKVLTSSYEIKEGSYILKDNMELLFDVDLKTLGVKEKVSLSSLEYNSSDHSLFILTSYEQNGSDEGLGAYLWKASLDKISNQKLRLTPINGEDGKVLHFPHKAEALTIMPGNRLLVVHDDDRVTGRVKITDSRNQFFRPRHMYAYTLLQVK
ncbi:hypothetical protein N9W79_02090 [bacterium]|nr:hypothetical protein [bacterium]